MVKIISGKLTSSLDSLPITTVLVPFSRTRKIRTIFLYRMIVPLVVHVFSYQAIFRIDFLIPVITIIIEKDFGKKYLWFPVYI